MDNNKIASGLSSLFTIAKNMVNDVDQYVDDSIQKERFNMCMECPDLIKLTNQCSKCGCFVGLKTKFKQEECPIQKWRKNENTN